MKLCVITLLGGADSPVASLGDRTPLAAAATPVLAGLAGGGRVGAVRTIPRKAEPSVEAALATLFGLDAAVEEPSPGALLAAALDVRPEPGERAFRCDLVNRYAGTVVDPTAGMLGEKEAALLVRALDRELGGPGIRFLPGFRWRALLLLEDGRTEKVRTTAPARFLGEPLEEHLPGRRAEVLLRLMEAAHAILEAHEINAVRVDLGENPANAAWIWGGGLRAPIPGFAGAGGVAVGGHPSFVGLAREAGLEVVRTGAETGPREEPEEVAGKVLEALDRTELVVAALEGGLVHSRLGEAEEKREWWERLDEGLLRPLAGRLVESGEGRLLVLPSHVAATAARRDLAGMVPFLVAGPGVKGYGGAAFSEAGAQAADLQVENGRELLEYAGRS